MEFLEKLAAVTPRPEINPVRYHGVLAPHARGRAEVVTDRRADNGRAPDPSAAAAGRGRAGSPRHWTWAALMRRAFDLVVLRCPLYAGRMQLIATFEDLAVRPRILAHLGLPGTREGPPPPGSQTEVEGEQPALPGVTVLVVPWPQAAAGVCPAAARCSHGELAPPTSGLRFDLRDPLWQDRREMRGAFIRAVPRQNLSLGRPCPRTGVMLSQLYGGTTLGDLPGPTPADGRARHRDGKKMESDEEKIERRLGRGDKTADGGRALIFVSASTKQVVGHVFNARNVQGRIQYWDEQQAYDAESRFAPSMQYFFYRTN